MIAGVSDHPKEECGVFGVFHPDERAATLCYFGLFALQHRGQESAGIAVSNGKEVRHVRAMGLVNQVFNDENLSTLEGHLGIGHTRYSTTGSSVVANAQPIFCQSLVGDIAVAHNGNLINTLELRAELEAEGAVFEGTNDSEVIARLLVRNLKDHSIIHAVGKTMRALKGAYSVVVLTPTMIIGFRDPFGIRPMVTGRMSNGGLVLASETCAFGPIAADVEREMEPGEMVILDSDGMRYAQGAPSGKPSMCLFEFIYFARPDSKMYGTSLYAARERMGMALAKEHPVDGDVVVPVPDSGIPAALGYAQQSGIPFREGMTKSRYIQRTFIQPDQRLRERGVRMKLTPLEDHLEGKKVILVDDSIVRATTTGQIVKMIREAGAVEVHVRITAPPIKWPCFYGIDMAKRSELAAANMTIEEIRRHIGADSLGYLSIDGATKAVRESGEGFCLACFNGEYPIPVPASVSKDSLEVRSRDAEEVRTTVRPV